MTTIQTAIESRFTKANRYGDIDATWYENGRCCNDIIKVCKADRDYYYNKVRKAYANLMASAPERHREKIAKMVEAYLEDTFTEDAYMLSVVQNTTDPRSMAAALAKYM